MLTCSQDTICRCMWEQSAAVQVLAQDKEKKIKAVCVVHNETATGITSSIPKIRQVLDEHSHHAMLHVDGVSSIGALPFYMDEWQVRMPAYARCWGA